jgi:ABC-2 type transport system ATP-binding protein
MIEFQDVTKAFGTTTAVAELTLTVNSGELFSLIGPNGAGKTTTIKMLTGLLRPDRGSIRINGIDLAQDPVDAKRITGYVPDAPYLYEHLTGREYLTVVGRLYNRTDRETASQIEYYREVLNIGDWLTQQIGGYSQGMKQRLLFAAALLPNPQVLVIDEPMVGLDPPSARIIKDLLKTQSRNGATVFLSTHNLNVAEELSDRIGIIHQGCLVRCGTLREFRQSARRDENLEEIFLQMVTEEPSASTTR